MTRATIVAVTLVTSALIAVLAVVARLIRDDRAELMQRFSEKRLQQLDEAAREIDEDFDDIADDLRFAGQLVEAADSAGDRERELGALIAVVRHYRMVRVFDARAMSVLSVIDPTWTLGLPLSSLDTALVEVASAAMAHPPGEVETSSMLAGDATGWLRAFATPLPSRAGAIVVVVDVEPLFRPLRLLMAEHGTHLLVLGPHGRPVPLTDAVLARVVDGPSTAAPGAVLLASMRSGARGTLGLGEREAAGLGLGAEETVAAFAPVRLPGGAHWSVATISGTAALRAGERAVFWRVGLGAGACVLCLFVFGTYVVVAERRAAAARARLRQTEEMGRLQEQLLRAEKMATVGVLAAGIAHEIGTPLGVVRARAEMTAGKLGVAHPQSAGVRVIIEQIDRVSRTIRQLLDFSCTRPVAVQAVDLGVAARAVQELLAWEGERRGVTLTVDVPAGLPAIAADPDQFQQVLVNLVMNGLDACTTPGHVELRGRVDERPSGPRAVRIEVVDTGCGIAPELRHQVFDPFFTTKKRGQGTGLGLTMTARIVEGHAGELELDSVEGRGTIVTMRWPAATPRAEAHHGV